MVRSKAQLTFSFEAFCFEYLTGLLLISFEGFRMLALIAFLLSIESAL